MADRAEANGAPDILVEEIRDSSVEDFSGSKSMNSMNGRSAGYGFRDQPPLVQASPGTVARVRKVAPEVEGRTEEGRISGLELQKANDAWKEGE
jgi:hypothetical protein